MEYITVLQRMVNVLSKDYDDELLIEVKRLVFGRRQLRQEEITRILYALISLYLIDEITTQPVDKNNFIDMGSYYYRSESFSIDFPSEMHKKYQIPIPHLSRDKSIFYGNLHFIKNYLKKLPTAYMGSLGLIIDKDVSFRMPGSRQVFLIEYFLQNPRSFIGYFNDKYTKEFKKTSLFKLRCCLKYSSFLASRLKDKQDNMTNWIKNIIEVSTENYIVTSSGTAANELAIKSFDISDRKSFYHKYWYYENLNDSKTSYFYEIKDIETTYDNFFICLDPTGYTDIDNPHFIENVKNGLTDLIKVLGQSSKKHTIIIDITTDIFFEIPNAPENITIVRTLSLSKYQEGINTSFAGLMIIPQKLYQEISKTSHHYGFTIHPLDKDFLYIPKLTLYKSRLRKIIQFNKRKFPPYKGWQFISSGIFMFLMPSRKIIQYHLKKFSRQSIYTDRSFAWLVRNKINRLIIDMKMQDVRFGDSFLFPDTRINIQGQEILPDTYYKSGFKFKYRLPRISPGYDCKLNEDMYYKFYTKVIDIYTEEYSKL